MRWRQPDFAAPAWTDDGARLARSAYALGLILVVVALATRLYLDTDASYFAFAAMTKPWAILWHYFPQRLGAELWCGGPAWLVAKLGAPPWLVAKVWIAVFVATPVVALALTRWFSTGAARAHWTLWLCVSFATLGLPMYGFPSEAWITLAMLWPALALIDAAPRDRPRQLAGFAVLALLVFSHQAVLLALPVIVVALWRSPRSRYLRALAIWFALLVAVWLVLWARYVPDNRSIELALVANQHKVLQWNLLLKAPLLVPASLLVLAWGLAASPQVLAKPVVRLGLIVIVLAAARALRLHVEPELRYQARSLVIWSMPVLGVIALASRRWTTPRAPLRWLLGPALAVQLAGQSRLIADFGVYRDVYFARVHQLPGPIDAAPVLYEVLAADRRAVRFYNGWAAPFTILMNDGYDAGPGVVIDVHNGYAPMHCDEAQAIFGSEPWRRVGFSKVMIADLCFKDGHPIGGLNGRGAASRP